MLPKAEEKGILGASVARDCCQIDLAGSSFDTLLAVYTGSSMNFLERVVFNNDCTADRPQSCAKFRVTAGSVLYIQVNSRVDPKCHRPRSNALGFVAPASKCAHRVTQNRA
jgi:hypothetical protein